MRADWQPVIERAREIVLGYDTRVTLRQLFYRLVAEGRIENTTRSYKRLSDLTARGRRAGTFPDLVDLTRQIERPFAFDDLAAASTWLIENYRLDRTAGQEESIYLGVEKRGLVALLEAWFGETGIPILPLGGYASQSFVQRVRRDVLATGRPAALVYAGDFDPSGADISRDFVKRTACFQKVTRVALNDMEQVEEFDLPPQPGKASDPRAVTFVAKHGKLVQVEIDALPPDALR